MASRTKGCSKRTTKEVVSTRTMVNSRNRPFGKEGRQKKMYRLIPAILIVMLVACTGTSMAAEPGGSPAILAAIEKSNGVAVLDHQSLSQIEGTFFCFPEKHPALNEVICEFMTSFDKGEQSAWLQEKVELHLDYFRTQIFDFFCNNFNNTGG